jgi:hypothetical protein
MTVFLITLAALSFCMLALGMNLLLGRTSEVRRGCGNDCECVRSGNSERACRVRQEETRP